MDAVVAVRALSKSYGEARVLHDVHLDIPRGALLSVTGRSGSGKSTLFRLLAGLEPSDEGSIVIDGRDIAHMDDEEAARFRLNKIGLVFQSLNLLPDLTVLENVRLPMDIAGVPREQAARRAMELIDGFGVGHLSARRPRAISGGEAQRVAIARALANRPSIILADEPTGSLDPRNAETVMDAFVQANERLGATVLIITHDPLAVAKAPQGFEVTNGSVRARNA